jgi:hypothetical protein
MKKTRERVRQDCAENATADGRMETSKGFSSGLFRLWWWWRWSRRVCLFWQRLIYCALCETGSGQMKYIKWPVVDASALRESQSGKNLVNIENTLVYLRQMANIWLFFHKWHIKCFIFHLLRNSINA